MPKKTKSIKDDPRVMAMANCMLFAVNSMRNKPVYDNATKTMETWHSWFKRVLTEAGYELNEPDKKP